jgi:hypothetical protein
MAPPALMIAVMLLTAEDPADQAALDKERQAAVAELAPAKARQLSVVVGAEQLTAQLNEEPLLRWSNPTAGSVFGEVFLWTVQNRPVAAASIYRWYHPYQDCTVEVVSLSASSLTAREGERSVWETRAGGFEWRPLTGIKPPAATDAARLSQMRAIARQFTVELTDRRGGESVTRELRQLAQPVYQYASPEQQVLGGVLFAFVEVTDPEAWLAIEAVTESDETKWQYGLARMNSDALTVRRGESTVQDWSKIEQPWKYKQAPYTTFGFDPKSVIKKPASEQR